MEELMAHAFQRSLQYERKLSCLGERRKHHRVTHSPPKRTPPEGENEEKSENKKQNGNFMQVSVNSKVKPKFNA